MITPTQLEREIILACKGWFNSDTEDTMDILKKIADKHYWANGFDTIDCMVTEVFDKYINIPASRVIDEIFHRKLIHTNLKDSTITKADVVDIYISYIRLMVVKKNGETLIDISDITDEEYKEFKSDYNSITE